MTKEICQVMWPWTLSMVQKVLFSLWEESLLQHESIKMELDHMTDKGIITPVREPTDWVNQMCVQYRKNGKLCLDPRVLNDNLKSEKTQQPILNEIRPELSSSCVFSKLDLREGYFHCILDEKSIYMTTFATPVICQWWYFPKKIDWGARRTWGCGMYRRWCCGSGVWQCWTWLPSQKITGTMWEHGYKTKSRKM